MICIFNGVAQIQEMSTQFYKFVVWHPLSLTIHKPIPPTGLGPENIQATMEQAYDAIMSGLVPEYQGFVENPDQ